ncbi:MAG: hypothetical protein WB611_11715 [Stellaceae bacterium]
MAAHDLLDRGGPILVNSCRYNGPAATDERGTRVTYLGQVHGMMSALKRMRVRNHGTIVNVGSALAYRSVPLQSIYCGAPRRRSVGSPTACAPRPSTISSISS